MRILRKSIQGLKKREPGKQSKTKAQGMVEFALILPLLLVLMFGVIEFGRMLFVYSVVYTASREGARYGSAAGVEEGSDVPNYINCDGIQAAAERLAILANVTEITIAYDEGSDADGNPINRTIGCPKPGIVGGLHRISVEVVAEYSTFIPLPSIPDTFTIQSENARTIISDIDLGIHMPPGMYAEQMNWTSYYEDPSKPNNSSWGFVVDVEVRDYLGNPLQGATVLIKWNAQNNNEGLCRATGVKGECSCTTSDEAGLCSIDVYNIKNNSESKQFWVDNITHPVYKLYNPISGEFTGTAIKP